MAQFIARIHGQRDAASRLGSKESGITASACGWNLGIVVEGRYNEETESDEFTVYLTGGSNHNGSSKLVGTFTRDDLEK